MSRTSLRPIGSSALVGSSSSRSRGGVDQGLGDAQTLLHAAREGADAGLDAAQAGEVEQGGDARLEGLRLEAEQAAGEAQELGRRHPGVKARHVGQESDKRPDLVGRALHVVAEHRGAARAGPGEATEDAQRGGLAGSVGAEKAEDRAGRHGQIDAVQGGVTAVALGQAAQLDGHRRRCLGHG
jgi:hypothetical protein